MPAFFFLQRNQLLSLRAKEAAPVNVRSFGGSFMLAIIPLTIVPLVLFNLVAFTLGEPWANELVPIPLISGAQWTVTPGDLMILLGLLMLFLETLRSAQVANSAGIANHIISTVVLIVYIVEFIVVRQAGNSLFFILTALALFDVVAGFTIAIKTAQRDISLAPAIDTRSH